MNAKVIVVYLEKNGTKENPAENLVEFSIYVKYFDSVKCDCVLEQTYSESQFFGGLVPVLRNVCDLSLIAL